MIIIISHTLTLSFPLPLPPSLPPSLSPPPVRSEPRPSSLQYRSVSPVKPHPPQVTEGEGKWTSVSVSLVWECMLRILADINKIETKNHSLALRCIAETWSKLEEVNNNNLSLSLLHVHVFLYRCMLIMCRFQFFGLTANPLN